jgi:hypothetical protein
MLDTRHKMRSNKVVKFLNISNADIDKRLKEICSKYEKDKNGKVTISYDDFNWLVYGIDEILVDRDYWKQKCLLLQKQ